MGGFINFAIEFFNKKIKSTLYPHYSSVSSCGEDSALFIVGLLFFNCPAPRLAYYGHNEGVRRVATGKPLRGTWPRNTFSGSCHQLVSPRTSAGQVCVMGCVTGEGICRVVSSPFPTGSPPHCVEAILAIQPHWGI